MSVPPIQCVYEGDGVFRALRRCMDMVAEHFGQGEVVTFEQHQERSMRSHSHYFAMLQEIFDNLPETDFRFSSFEHFRKHALIACGYHDERSIVCANRAEAQRVAAFARPLDEYAVVTVREAVVTVYTAKSQSLKAMGKDAFQKSKDDVLGWAAMQIGSTVEAVAQNARSAA